MLMKSGAGYEAGDFAVAYDDLHPLAAKYYLDITAFGNNRPVGKVLKPSNVKNRVPQFAFAEPTWERC